MYEIFIKICSFQLVIHAFRKLFKHYSAVSLFQLELMLGIFRQCNSLPETLFYKTMTQPSLIFIFKIKTCTTFTKDFKKCLCIHKKLKFSCMCLKFPVSVHEYACTV